MAAILQTTFQNVFHLISKLGFRLNFTEVRFQGPSWKQTSRRFWDFMWRHQMETFSALLAICAGNSPVPGEIPTQKPVTRSFDVFYYLHLNKRSRKQSWGWWFETLSRPLWCHCSVWEKSFEKVCIEINDHLYLYRFGSRAIEFIDYIRRLALMHTDFIWKSSKMLLSFAEQRNVRNSFC